MSTDTVYRSSYNDHFASIVYDPTAQSESNERQSIQLWQQFAEECGLVSAFPRTD